MSTDETKKTRAPKAGSIPMTEVESIFTGLPRTDKAQFAVWGHHRGCRIAVPKNNGVSRAYYYGSVEGLPKHPAIRLFTKEQSKEQRRGAVTAEVEFGQGPDLAREALKVIAHDLSTATPPAPKGLKRVRLPKAPKALAGPVTPNGEQAAQDCGPDTDVRSDDLADEALA